MRCVSELNYIGPVSVYRGHCLSSKARNRHFFDIVKGENSETESAAAPINRVGPKVVYKLQERSVNSD